MITKETYKINKVIKMIYLSIKNDLKKFDLTKNCDILGIEFIPSTKHVCINLYDNVNKNSIDWYYTYETFANLDLVDDEKNDREILE